MANVIKLRKGLDINLKGKAHEKYLTVSEPRIYAIVPDDFPGITPKVVVKEQEYVMAGGPLFIDKNHPEVKFVSPVSGVVTSVERGARRKVLNIVVEAAEEQDYEEFGKKNVNEMNADSIKSVLLESGIFAFIRQRPYDIVADPTSTPKGIFISAALIGVIDARRFKVIIPFKSAEIFRYYKIYGGVGVKKTAPKGGFCKKRLLFGLRE